MDEACKGWKSLLGLQLGLSLVYGGFVAGTGRRDTKHQQSSHCRLLGIANNNPDLSKDRGWLATAEV